MLFMELNYFSPKADAEKIKNIFKFNFLKKSDKKEVKYIIF